jgi:stress response protein YsnF
MHLSFQEEAAVEGRVNVHEWLKLRDELWENSKKFSVGDVVVCHSAKAAHANIECTRPLRTRWNIQKLTPMTVMSKPLCTTSHYEKERITYIMLVDGVVCCVSAVFPSDGTGLKTPQEGGIFLPVSVKR